MKTMLLKRIRNFLVPVLFGFLMGLSGPAVAEDITFTAEVNTTRTELGAGVLLTLTLTGVSSFDPIDLPEIDGFTARYVGPRTQFLMINGKSSNSISLMYTLYPTKVGTFEVPSLTVTVNGQTLTSEPIRIEVAPMGAGTAATAGGSPGATLQDKIFLVISVPRTEVYLNEKIPLALKLFVHEQLNAQPVSNMDLNRAGFDISQETDARQYSQVVGGEGFHVVEYTAYLYPKQAGTLSLGPAQMTCRVLVQGQGRPSVFDDIPGFLGDDEFFKGLLNQEWREIPLRSGDIAIQVFPLPDEGKPKDFSGGVGTFRFEVTAGPSEVKVGDPVTLRMEVAGEGNLSAVTLPAFQESKDWKVYEPQVHETTDKKTLEQVIIPVTDKVQEVPAVSFSYFDSEQRKYVTVTKGPFPLKVTADASAPAAKIVSSPLAEESAAPETLGSDIHFIKETPGTFRETGRSFSRGAVFPLFLVLVAGMWGGWYARHRFTSRLRDDTVYARKLLAPRKARKGLAAARQAMDRGEQKAFYDALFKAFQDYLGDKSHRPAGTLTTDTIRTMLAEHPFPPALAEGVRTVLSECEMVRYASAALTRDNMQNALAHIEQAVDFLERNWS